jgi:prevent-host-death family protein
MYTSQMKVNATYFKSHCLALIDRAATTGEVITITKRGRVVAKLVGDVEQDVRPWRALRAHEARWHGDPFEPAVHEEDLEAVR